MIVKKGDWADAAIPGSELTCRVTPRARKPQARREGVVFHIAVTPPPEDGRATAAVTEILAHGLGVAKTRLTLIRGATARDKVFRLD